jgi:predicted site-specific integrase-resolvase
MKAIPITGYLSAAQVSQLLGVSGRTVRNRAKSGAIPSVQLSPGRIAFEPHVVQRLLDEERQAHSLSQ